MKAVKTGGTGITAAGTVNTVAKYTAGNTLGNSAITDDATTASLGTRFAVTEATGIVATYNNQATAGVGMPSIVGRGRTAAATAAVSSVAAFTVGAADASFIVSMNVRVTTATTHAFTCECAYTDEAGTARVLTMTFGLVAGGVTTTSIANATGAVPYHGVPLHIRADALSTITLRTQAAGTYTTVTYNVEGTIQALAVA